MVKQICAKCGDAKSPFSTWAGNGDFAPLGAGIPYPGGLGPCGDLHDWQDAPAYPLPEGRRVVLMNALPASFMVPMGTVDIKPISVETAVRIYDAYVTESGIGHADTAALVSGILGREVPMNRVSLAWTPGTIILGALYTGPRLPEGTTVLPEGASLSFYVVGPAYIQEGASDARLLEDRANGHPWNGSIY